jgi:integrase
VPRKLTGLRRKRGGWQAYVKVHGKTYTRQYPLETPIADMRAWRDTQKKKHRGAQATPVAFGFEADVTAYLKLPDVAAMPSVTQRAAHLQLWLDALGRDRARVTITPIEIEAVLQTWLLTLSPVTVDHRRTALLSFFVKLDGADGANPVRATNKPRLPEPEARDVDYPTIARILDAMPTARSSAPGTVRKLSLAKLRATVIAYTGIPPASLLKMVRADLDLPGATFRSPARAKGQGARARILPLTADGLAAFRAFAAADAFGWFSVGALSHSFKRAVRSVPTAPPAMRLYDLRHSFGAELYRRTGDLATVARFLGHTPGSTVTARYALGANAQVDRAAADAFNAARAAEQLPPAIPQAAVEAARARKGRSRKRLRKVG